MIHCIDTVNKSLISTPLFADTVSRMHHNYLTTPDLLFAFLITLATREKKTATHNANSDDGTLPPITSCNLNFPGTSLCQRLAAPRNLWYREPPSVSSRFSRGMETTESQRTHSTAYSQASESLFWLFVYFAVLFKLKIINDY